MSNSNSLRKLMIEISSRCNYTCEGCPNLDLPRGKGNMNSGLFKQIFDEVGNKVEKVMLWNYGEPLGHPEIETMLTYANQFSAVKVLSTNGSYFGRFRQLDFLRTLDVLVVSINGLDQETYSFHQKGGILQNVIAGTKRVCDYLKDSNTITVFQTVVNRRNLAQVPRIDEFARALGFKEVTLKSFNVMDDSDATFDRFVPAVTGFTRYDGHKDKRISTEKSTFCQDGLVINWNGEVNPCCWDYKGTHILGSVLTDTISNIWDNSKPLRDSLAHGTNLDICGNCEVNRSIARWQIS
ncbi:MAG: radical SAM protein [Candidatus Woesearchaeota archaeon]